MQRKVYGKLLDWKEKSKGSTAVLIDGARRVGKSYIAEEFARDQYKSYIMIDFNRAGKDIRELFLNRLENLDAFFMYLSAYYNKKLYERESVIIFDEVQCFPRALQNKCGRPDGDRLPDRKEKDYKQA